MKRKSIWAIIISLIVIVICVLFLLKKNNQKANLKTVSRNDNAGLTIHKNKKKKLSSSASSASLSNDDWMLMGYMAYAHDNYVQSRHVKNTSDLVKDVQEDLSDGSLKAGRINNTTYQLSNKFGSVNILVESDDIKITGDGTTIVKKDDAKKTFNSYINQINQMTNSIKNGKVVNEEDQFNPNSEMGIKKLAIIAGFCVDKKYTEQTVKNKIKDGSPVGTASYGYSQDSGWYHLDGHGDATTWFGFKLENNILYTKHVEMQPGKSVGQSPTVTRKRPLSVAIKKFYSTPAEKAEVDDLANRLLSDKEFDIQLKKSAE